MAQTSHPDPDRFNELLSWLGDDCEEATTEYLSLRRALTKIFLWNECSDPEGLTDETFNRVSKKLPALKETYEGNPRPYFYAVANNLIKEQRKVAKSQVSLDGVDLPGDPAAGDQLESAEMRSECLESCLQNLSSEKRELILSYYSREKAEKFSHRAEMARRAGVTIGAFRVRMLRIRTSLEECIERCLDEKSRNK